MSDFEAYLRSLKEGCTPSRTVDAMFYSLLGGGKRVRPRLLFAALHGYGLPEQAGYPCAAAIEMIHTYSLIHDDLPAMDDDTLRRGRKTCHIAFDEATAILAGDGLLTDAFGWEASFWLNVPVCAAAIVATALFVPESRAPRPRRLDLRAQRGLHLARGNKAHRRARRAQAGQPLQREHGDAVARHRHGEYVQNAHQSFASSAVMVVSYLPVFCAS